MARSSRLAEALEAKTAASGKLRDGVAPVSLSYITPPIFRRGAQVLPSRSWPMSLAPSKGSGEDNLGKRELIETGRVPTVQILVTDDAVGDRVGMQRLIDAKGYTDLAFERFAHLVERSIECRGVRYGQSLKLLVGFEDSYEFDAETLHGLFLYREKVGWGETEGNGIKLGGLKKRSDEEIRTWLSERQSYASLKTVHGSLAGCDPVHDRWNGRKADFDYLFRIILSGGYRVRTAQTFTALTRSYRGKHRVS